MELTLRCINCGAKADILYEGSTADTIELKTCEHCGETLDHYLEYDVVIVILDMVLMIKEAYRHILFNTKFERHWKMAVLIILVQGFYGWSSLCNTTRTSPSDIIIFDEKVYGTFLLQMSFFCFLSAFELSIFMAFITMLSSCYWRIWPKRKPDGFRHLTLWKALVLASFQQFFLVAPIIWQMLNSGPHIRAIQVFQFLSTILAFSVVCFTSWATSAAIVTTGVLCKTVLRHLVVWAVLGQDICEEGDLCELLTM